jgi:uncharacterized protein (TIGR02996 family)
MSDRLAMLAAIHDLPDDDLPRLAYADWMEENGQPERGEFIRVHLAMERVPRGTPKYRRLWEREVELIATFKDEWFGIFRRRWSFYEVKRGFLDEIQSAAEHVVPHAGWLLESHAVQRLCVGSPGVEALGVLLASPLVATLRQLRYFTAWARGSPYYPEVLSPLPGPALPLAERPLDLAVTGFMAGQELAAMLVGSPHLGRLARLDVSDNVLDLGGTRRLLDAFERWPRLYWLAARGGGNLTTSGIIALAGHPAASRLRVLDLSGTSIDRSACAALLSSPHLAALERLRLPTPPRAMRERLTERFGPRVEWPAPQQGR